MTAENEQTPPVEGDVRWKVKGMSLNTILTLLSFLGVGGLAGGAYTGKLSITPQPVDQIARDDIAKTEEELQTHRTRIWESVGDLQKAQAQTNTQLQVLITNVDNIGETVSKYIERTQTLDDRRDERIRILENTR